MGDVHDMHIYMYMLGVVRASLSRVDRMKYTACNFEFTLI